MIKINPFITNGYISAAYFCDRIVETEMLTRYITNGNNIALITSSGFLRTYKLTASSVQGAIKGLLDKDFVTCELGEYSVYDKFFESWLRKV